MYKPYGIYKLLKNIKILFLYSIHSLINSPIISNNYQNNFNTYNNNKNINYKSNNIPIVNNNCQNNNNSHNIIRDSNNIN